MSSINSVGKKNCDVFTSIDIVKYMLDLSEYTPDKDLSHIKVIEPSCGEGEFAVEIIKRLIESSRKFKFDPSVSINKHITFYDTDQKKIDITINRVKDISDNLSISNDIFKCEDYLLASVASADLIIGNPPYIRNEQIDKNKKALYRELYTSFKYRSDIYVPFFEKSLSSLTPNGKHCFVCSNRWLRNQYGQLLRDIITKSYNLRYIINLEKVNPFQEDVIAYPAITIIDKGVRQDHFCYLDVNNITDLRESGIKYENRLTPKSNDWSVCFSRISINPNLSTIEDMGFKIGIGVATGADKIFIGDNLCSHIEEELLLPILTSKDIKGDSICWNGKYIFNPFDKDGRIIDLQYFPRAHAYLLSHIDCLQKRHVAKRNPQSWYRTIDKIDNSLMSKPKILLADISANNYIKIDSGKYYPHHNLYYITGSDLEDLTILSAILMSDFVVSQLHSLSNKMNGGYPRWQSQYVKKLKMPNLFKMSARDKDILASSYRSNNVQGINSVVNSVVNSMV